MSKEKLIELLKKNIGKSIVADLIDGDMIILNYDSKVKAWKKCIFYYGINELIEEILVPENISNIEFI